MDNRKYALVILGNEAVANDIEVCIKSFVHRNSWFNGDIVIINDDELCTIEDWHKEKIKKLYKNIIFRIVDKSEYAPIIEKWKKSEARWTFYPVFYRFECFGMNEYDALVWVDPDILFLDSIIELFEDNEVGAMCVVDKIDKHLSPFMNTNKCSHRKGNYINNGVMCLSGKFLNMKDKILDFTKNFKLEHNPGPLRGLYADQDVLNAFFNNEDVILLPCIYNCASWVLGTINNINYLKDVKILHFSCNMNRKDHCRNTADRFMYKLLEYYGFKENKNE